MIQKREGTFLVLMEDIEYESFLQAMKEEKFATKKTLEGNKFSTPFQDIWLASDQIHQVGFVNDSITNTNYIRILGEFDIKLVGKIGSWFPDYERGELCEVADKALTENDEDEAPRAIFNIGITYYVNHRAAMMMFERYLKSPSVKVRLATIRAIGFQLWNECIPLLENLISSDPNPAVKAYAKETLRQIQQPDFDPDDLYENPSNYPHSFERITEKGLTILPQIKDDLQTWMKENGYTVVDALVLYQYLIEVYSEFKPTDEPIEEKEHDSEQKIETIEPDQTKITQIEQLQQQIAEDKKQLNSLRFQLTKTEERIENARKTNIFGRKQSGNDEQERDKLVREIEDAKARIKQNESLLKAEEEQIESN